MDRPEDSHFTPLKCARETTEQLRTAPSLECFCNGGSDRVKGQRATCAEELRCFSGMPAQAKGDWEAGSISTASFEGSTCKRKAACPAGRPGACVPGRTGRARATCEDGRYPTSDGMCNTRTGGNRVISPGCAACLPLLVVATIAVSNLQLVSRSLAQATLALAMGRAIATAQTKHIFCSSPFLGSIQPPSCGRCVLRL